MRPRPLLATLLALLMLLGGLPGAWAQQQPGTAEVKRATGRVEVLRKGQTQWLPAVVGARLAEGDDVRAFSGASAELELPDGSTLLVAENSRVIVTKLDFDAQRQGRTVLFHLVVGKVFATVSQATLTLLRARQSNFVITTPTAVAAARGTEFEVLHDAGQQVTRVAVIRTDPKKRSPSVVTCGSFFDRYRVVVVTENHYTEVGPGPQGCRPQLSIDTLSESERQALGTATNLLPPPPPGALSMSVTPPALVDTPGVSLGPTPVFFDPGPSLVSGVTIPAGGPSTIGADLAAGPPIVPPGLPCPTPAPSPPPPCP